MSGAAVVADIMRLAVHAHQTTRMDIKARIMAPLAPRTCVRRIAQRALSRALAPHALARALARHRSSRRGAILSVCVAV